jgi:TatD DNase family protein
MGVDWVTGGSEPVRWADSHSHLQEKYLSTGTLAGSLSRASEAGVKRIVCVGTGPGTSGAALTIAADNAAGRHGATAPELWATAGLHPHDAAEGTAAILEVLEASVDAGASIARGGRLVAVGECGLDYHYEHSPRDAQRRAFADQVAAARRLGLALVVHAREAWDDLFDVLAAEGVPERTVLHCFTGGPQEARRCLDAGMFVSFSGILTFKNASEIREAAALCPLDRLLVETDSPFLAPVPHRGRPNEPAYVPLVGHAVAEVKGLTPGEVAAASWDATSAVFGL